jgi:uncharacterized membrane protein YadS
MSNQKSQFNTEDWWAVYLGLLVFVLSLGPFGGLDIIGWVVTPKIWTELSKSIGAFSKNYAGLSNFLSLFLTYVAYLVVLTIGAASLGLKLGKFIYGFTVIFWLTYACVLVGSFANIAANAPGDIKKFNLSWSLRLTQEAGLICALLAGLFISNLLPRFAESLREAARPEWYIKTAIVILGAALGVKAVTAMALATKIMFLGLCSIVVAYLLYWALVYLMARTWFKFSREWAAPLASGISICGVSAAIATGAAIRARPIVAIMVSSLVVIFAVVELIFLPFLAQSFLYNDPLTAGAWMALAVKTDGAAVASGQIVDSLILAKALAVQGIRYEPGWILSTATTVKIFIDIMIGVWAFILAVIWCTVIECKPGEKVRVVEIWHRFPKFIIGYALTFLVMLFICLKLPGQLNAAKAGSGAADVFRSLFFALTFFSIGLVSNFRKLWEEGIGKLALVYFVALFGFIIWMGLGISWVFFHGVKPPIIGG